MGYIEQHRRIGQGSMAETEITHALLALFIPVCWLIWATIWFAAARSVKKTIRREDDISRLTNSAPLFIAGVLLAFPRQWLGILGAGWHLVGFATYILAAVLVAAGLGFAIWARYHLGRNWSGVITVKEDHTLVGTGPYALVRHPIYTGLLVAIIGSAIARADLAALLAIACASFSIIRRVDIEERWMSETFGEAYARYRLETPALVPFTRSG
jgi:protein-S-isoprenylcysteine O-methyltransferase Ste14